MVAIKSMNKVWVVAAGLCVAAGSAGAFGVAITANSVTGAQATNITVTGTATLNGVLTGMYKAATSGPGAPTGSPFDVFCIDPKTSGSASGSYSEVSLYSFLNTVTSVGPPSRTGYQEQFTNPGYTGAANYSANSNTTEVLNNIVNLYSHAYKDADLTAGAALRADKLTAFGYVLWEIMGEAAGGLGRSIGGLTETNSLSANVNTWIDKYVSALTGGVTTWATLGLGLKNDTFTYSVFYDALAHTGQNFLRVTPSGSNGGITSIPEPGTIALAGLALLGTFRASRRKAVMA